MKRERREAILIEVSRPGGGFAIEDMADDVVKVRARVKVGEYLWKGGLDEVAHGVPAGRASAEMRFGLRMALAGTACRRLSRVDPVQTSPRQETLVDILRNKLLLREA